MIPKEDKRLKIKRLVTSNKIDEIKIVTKKIKESKLEVRREAHLQQVGM